MTATEITAANPAETEFDPAKAEAFGGQVMGILAGGLLSLMVDVGHRTGLFAAAAQGWATSEQLADRAGLSERYVREWLGAMATAGIVEYDQASERFRLPPEHAALLTSPTGVAPLAVTTTILARHIPQIAQAFREGGGVPYAAFGPEFTDAWDAVGRGVYDTMLVSDYLPLSPGLADALTAGVRVADVACGTGHALVVLARAFPAFDVHRLRPRRARHRTGARRGGRGRADERELRGGRGRQARGTGPL